jgi:hypothetical protein
MFMKPVKNKTVDNVERKDPHSLPQKTNENVEKKRELSPAHLAADRDIEIDSDLGYHSDHDEVDEEEIGREGDDENGLI